MRATRSSESAISPARRPIRAASSEARPCAWSRASAASSGRPEGPAGVSFSCHGLLLGTADPGAGHDVVATIPRSTRGPPGLQVAAPRCRRRRRCRSREVGRGGRGTGRGPGRDRRLGWRRRGAARAGRRARRGPDGRPVRGAPPGAERAHGAPGAPGEALPAPGRGRARRDRRCGPAAWSWRGRTTTCWCGTGTSSWAADPGRTGTARASTPCSARSPSRRGPGPSGSC